MGYRTVRVLYRLWLKKKVIKINAMTAKTHTVYVAESKHPESVGAHWLACCAFSCIPIRKKSLVQVLDWFIFTISISRFHRMADKKWSDCRCAPKATTLALRAFCHFPEYFGHDFQSITSHWAHSFAVFFCFGCLQKRSLCPIEVRNWWSFASNSFVM